MATTATITPRLTHTALRIVFGDESPIAAEIGTIATLTQRELAACFRRRAMELHPDRAGALGVSTHDLERSFKQLHGAYRLLGRLVEDERLRNRVLASAANRSPERGLWTPTREQPAPGQRRAAGDSDAEPFRTGPDERSRTADAGRRYYRGRVPQGQLRFAQFLYYHQVIDWQTMIDAVTWQYRVRPKLGEIGRSYRFLDFDAVTRVLRSSPRGELFGNTAMRLGVLDRRQLSVVLGKQHQLNYPIGRYFLERGILSRPEIDHLLAQNRRHNMKARTS